MPLIEQKWVSPLSTEGREINIQVGDIIRLYGKETIVEGFYGSYNGGLLRWETILLTTGRGDPFERSLDNIEVDADSEFKSPYTSLPPATPVLPEVKEGETPDPAILKLLEGNPTIEDYQWAQKAILEYYRSKLSAANARIQDLEARWQGLQDWIHSHC